MRIVERCLSQFHIEKRRRQRMASVLFVLSLFIAIGVSWNLRLTGITMANEAFCGQEEHQATRINSRTISTLPFPLTLKCTVRTSKALWRTPRC